MNLEQVTINSTINSNAFQTTLVSEQDLQSEFSTINPRSNVMTPEQKEREKERNNYSKSTAKISVRKVFEGI